MYFAQHCIIYDVIWYICMIRIVLSGSMKMLRYGICTQHEWYDVIDMPKMKQNEIQSRYTHGQYDKWYDKRYDKWYEEWYDMNKMQAGLY